MKITKEKRKELKRRIAWESGGSVNSPQNLAMRKQSCEILMNNNSIICGSVENQLSLSDR